MKVIISIPGYIDDFLKGHTKSRLTTFIRPYIPIFINTPERMPLSADDIHKYQTSTNFKKISFMIDEKQHQQMKKIALSNLRSLNNQYKYFIYALYTALSTGQDFYTPGGNLIYYNPSKEKII